MTLPQKNEDRTIKRKQFLDQHHVCFDERERLGNDASFRTYYRIKEPRSMLLMDSPAAHEPVAPFVTVATHLQRLGLRSPEIYEQDLENNFLLIEDFGEDTFTRLLNRGVDEEKLYTLAVDALIFLHNHPHASDIDIKAYTTKHFIEETGRSVNWYYPVKTGEKPSDHLKKEWVQAWKKVFDLLPPAPQTLVLRDFHCDNLMLLDDQNVKACGLLDFQDALLGPAAYDLVSILENDRRAVPEELQVKLVSRYLEKAELGMSKESFQKWYRILSAQRQFKILGLFYRLAIRDHKEGYLAFIPQVCHLLNHSLQDDILAPVADVVARHFGELCFIKTVDYDHLRKMKLDDTLPIENC